MHVGVFVNDRLKLIQIMFTGSLSNAYAETYTNVWQVVHAYVCVTIEQVLRYVCDKSEWLVLVGWMHVWVFIVHHSLVISLGMTCTALVNACVTTECMCDRCSLFFLQIVWQLNKILELGYWGLCDWCHKGDLWWQLCHYLLPFWPTCLF